MGRTLYQLDENWRWRISEIDRAITRAEILEPGSEQFDNYFPGYVHLAMKALQDIRKSGITDQRFVQVIEELEGFLMHHLGQQENAGSQENIISIEGARANVSEIETRLRGLI